MPRWRRDGQALFYRGPDDRIREVRVSGADKASVSGTFAHTSVEVLPISAPASSNSGYFTYQPSSDGQRFLIVQPIPTPLAPTTIVLNWQATLGATTSAR